MRRTALLGPLLLAATALLAACDPAGPATPVGSANLDITVDAEGGASADLMLDAHRRSDAELMGLGLEVAPLLFPGSHGLSVATDANGGGYHFVTITTRDAYRPGAHPKFRLDTTAAVGHLLGHDLQRVDVYVTAPSVSSSASWTPAAEPVDYGQDVWAWEGLARADAAPAGVIRLEPAPWRGALALALAYLPWVLVAVGAAAVARRQRILALVAGLTAFGILAATFAVPTLAWLVDDLGVGGYLSGTLLTVARWLPLTLLVTGPAGLAIGVAALAMPRRRGATPGAGAHLPHQPAPAP